MKLFDRLFRRNSLTCHQVEQVMQQYLDQELEPAQVPKVLRHLEACRDCGLEAQVYERIKASLRAHQLQPDEASMQRVRDMARQLATD